MIIKTFMEKSNIFDKSLNYPTGAFEIVKTHSIDMISSYLLTNTN